LTEDPKEHEVRASKALKQGRATEAAQAMSEYIAERNAERAKTARLRAYDWPKRRPIKQPNKPRQRRSGKVRLEHRRIEGQARCDYGVAQMPPTNPTSNVITDQLTCALGQAIIRIWSNLPQEVQDHLFKEAVSSQGESIRSQLAVFLHDKHMRTSDPLGNPREMKEPDSLGG
jgi:hypothetical protein